MIFSNILATARLSSDVPSYLSFDQSPRARSNLTDEWLFDLVTAAPGHFVSNLLLELSKTRFRLVKQRSNGRVVSIRWSNT